MTACEDCSIPPDDVTPATRRLLLTDLDGTIIDEFALCEACATERCKVS